MTPHAEGMQPPRITVEATVRAHAAVVWETFTAPEHVVQWNAASDDWHCPRAENDLRVGGRFRYRMEAVDGSVGFDFEGEFTEVRAGELIAYRMDDAREVRVTFAAADGGILVRETFDAEGENPEDLQRAGWQSILDRFRVHAESRA